MPSQKPRNQSQRSKKPGYQTQTLKPENPKKPSQKAKPQHSKSQTRRKAINHTVGKCMRNFPLFASAGREEKVVPVVSGRDAVEAGRVPGAHKTT